MIQKCTAYTNFWFQSDFQCGYFLQAGQLLQQYRVTEIKHVNTLIYEYTRCTSNLG